MKRRHILPIRSRLVLYDGGCGMCNRSVEVLLKLDALRRLRFADIDGDWDWIARDFPRLDHDACLAEMHVITNDGKTFAGFDAFRSIAQVLPMCWPLVPLLYIPGVPWAGRRLYRRLAASRTTSTCAVGAGRTVRPGEKPPRHA